MSAFLTLWLKEIRDNLRDRRSMFFTLLYGPLMLPTLMIGPLIFTVNKHSVNPEQTRPLSVVGLDRAPNLAAYLVGRNFKPESVDVEREQLASWLRDGDASVVLEIPDTYGAALAEGEPAPLMIHYDSGNDAAEPLRRQLKSALDAYHGQLRELRYWARGIDPGIFEPLSISERDVAEREVTEAFVGLMLPFIVLFSMMMGGFYLAVDSTAGERERLSLEPLLALPVPRRILVAGKYAAVLTFVLLSLILPLITAFIGFQFMDDSGFASRYDFSMSTFLWTAVLYLPVALLLTAFLLVIAAFSRSTKEAQTQLGLAMMVPMLPFFLLQFLNIPDTPGTAAVPLLGQYQIALNLVMGRGVDIASLAASVSVTVLLSAGLLLLTVYRYRQEKILP